MPKVKTEERDRLVKIEECDRYACCGVCGGGKYSDVAYVAWFDTKEYGRIVICKDCLARPEETVALLPKVLFDVHGLRIDEDAIKERPR
jgi:hypothetical protein